MPTDMPAGGDPMMMPPGGGGAMPGGPMGGDLESMLAGDPELAEMMGDPGGGMGGLDGLLGGMGGMGASPTAMPMPGAMPYVQLSAPLDGLSMIAHDYNVDLAVKQGKTNARRLADDIWQEYGGNKFGGIDDAKVGERVIQDDLTEEMKQMEAEDTQDSKWKRLPDGLNIAQAILGMDKEDFADPQEAYQMLYEYVLGYLRSSAAAAVQPQQPALAFNLARRLIVANYYDQTGNHNKADLLDAESHYLAQQMINVL